MIAQIGERMRTRSAALPLTIQTYLDAILSIGRWAPASHRLHRIAITPRTIPTASMSTFASYMLVVVAPFVSTLLALRWFSNGNLQAQPVMRLARAGRWQPVNRGEAERHSLYGTSGLMVSLLVGMMVNVPVRVAEYLAAMPPTPIVSPAWLSTLHFAMTVDVVLFTSLYMIAFVAALRRVPLFPRLLLAIWIGDLAMQLATAEIVSTTYLPMAVASALHTLLLGNVKKVLISMALWLPYLLLSTRVNVTYRHRIPS